MPNPWVKKLSNETGKSINEVEKLWSKAKNIAEESLGKELEKFESKDYAYVVGIVKNMLGLDERLIPSNFLSSSKKAKQFIEEITSDSFGINNTLIPPKEVIEQPEEKELGDNIEYSPEDIDNEPAEVIDQSPDMNIGLEDEDIGYGYVDTEEEFLKEFIILNSEAYKGRQLENAVNSIFEDLDKQYDKNKIKNVYENLYLKKKEKLSK